MNGGNQPDVALVILVAVAVIGAVCLLVFIITYLGYRRYKKPLLEVDASVQYGFIHYLKLVVFPRIAYRLRSKFPGKSSF